MRDRKEYLKKWREEHKEHIKQYKKEYAKTHDSSFKKLKKENKKLQQIIEEARTYIDDLLNSVDRQYFNITYRDMIEVNKLLEQAELKGDNNDK